MISQLIERREQTKKRVGLNRPSFNVLKEIQEAIYRMRREMHNCPISMKPFLRSAIRKKQRLLSSVSMKPVAFIQYVAQRNLYGELRK